MKTIRLNKKVFFAMMVITPFFAAFTTAFIFMLIFSPFKTTAPLEVPILGGVVEEATEEPIKTEVSKEETVTEAPKEEVSEVVTETKALMVAQAPSITQKPVEQPVKVETKPIEKTAEEIAEEACEARTDAPARLIVVRHLLENEIIFYKNLGIENPAVDYTEYIAPDGHNKMIYTNGGCVPSRKNLVVDEQRSFILGESQLGSFGIVIPEDYDTWI